MNAEEKIEWKRLSGEHDEIFESLAQYTAINVLTNKKNISRYEIDLIRGEFIEKLEKKEREMADFAERNLLN